MIDPLHGREHRVAGSRPPWLPAGLDALTRRADATFAFTAFMTADLVLCGLLASLASALSGGSLPFLPLVALLVAAQKPLVDRVASRLLGCAGPFVAWSWLAGLSTVFVTGALVALHDPIVCSHFRCGTGDVAFVLASPLWVLSLGTVVTIALQFALAPERRAFRKALAIAVPVVFVAAGAITLVQTARSAWLADAQGYFDRMPTVAVFGAPALPSLDETERFADPEPTRAFVDRQGGLEMTRVCGLRSRSCDVQVRFGSDISLPREASDGFRWASANDVIRVMRDEPNHVFVFVREDRSVRGSHPGGVRPQRGFFAAAYDWQRRDWVSISAADIAHGTAAPRGWTVGAVLGLALAVFVARSMRRVRIRVRADLERFRTGHLGTDGTLTFDGGLAPVKLAATTDFGPVVVFRGSEPEIAHYRDDAQRVPTHLAFGTKRHLRDAASSALWARAMYALAVLLLASAPMLAFTWVQLR